MSSYADLADMVQRVRNRIAGVEDSAEMRAARLQRAMSKRLDRIVTAVLKRDRREVNRLFDEYRNLRVELDRLEADSGRKDEPRC